MNNQGVQSITNRRPLNFACNYYGGGLGKIIMFVNESVAYSGAGFYYGNMGMLPDEIYKSGPPARYQDIHYSISIQ